MTQTLILVFVLACLIPGVTYITVKLATYAFFRGRQQFQMDTQKEPEHGSQTTERTT